MLKRVMLLKTSQIVFLSKILKNPPWLSLRQFSKKVLRLKSYEIQRKSCVIIDNICRLIEDPKDVSFLYNILYSSVKDASINISNPETRKIAVRTLQTIDELYDSNLKSNKMTIEQSIQLLEKYNIQGHASNDITLIIKNLYNLNNFNKEVWLNVLTKYGISEEKCLQILDDCQYSSIPKTYVFEDIEEGQDLYKGVLSLAYGTLTLLKNAHIHLKRNRFYGLLGVNNCGKTTFMRAI